MKKVFIVTLVVIFVGAIYVARTKPSETPVASPPVTTVVLATPNPYITSKTPKEVAYKVVEYTRDLSVPWAIAFTGNNRILVTERGGKLREVLSGKLTTEPLLTYTDISSTSEDGLMGLTLDPSYDSNKFVYVCLAYTKGDSLLLKIEKLRDNGANASKEAIILDNIPAAHLHVGCRLRFGPDGKLYATIGDTTTKNIAQDLTSLAGKILRLNTDGSIPSDNPFPGSAIYSYGHRNPQGLDWYPQSNVLFSTEHGPSGNDGPRGGDEVNVIEPGGNYGWPLISHEQTRDGLISPKLVFTPSFAPASGMFYSGRVFPQFYGNFFFGGLVGKGIMRVQVEKSNPSKILSYERLPDISYGRIRDVEQGPDGYIYFTTSNRDGRGTPVEGDDKIYRIVPR